jgi:hypothetical protein
VAQGVGVVGIFIARGNLQHALFEYSGFTMLSE